MFESGFTVLLQEERRGIALVKQRTRVAAGAACGMAQVDVPIVPDDPSRPTIGITNLGILTAGAMHAIERLRDHRDDGLAPYLAGRQLLFRRRFTEALPEIVDARERGLPTERSRREARRMEGMIRFGAGQLDESAAIWLAIVRDESASEGERVMARDWLARIRYARAH